MTFSKVSRDLLHTFFWEEKGKEKERIKGMVRKKEKENRRVGRGGMLNEREEGGGGSFFFFFFFFLRKREMKGSF